MIRIFSVFFRFKQTFIFQILTNNLARVGLVWMDDWSKFYFKFNHIGSDLTESLNVKSRLKLRENLNCKSFDWYLENVWPENFFPSDSRFFGKLMLVDTNSKYFKKYVRLLREFSNQNDDSWIGLIEFLRSKLNFFANELQLEKNQCSFCMTKPSLRGAINQPYGPPLMEPCGNNSLDLREMFVGTEIGMVCLLLFANEN